MLEVDLELLDACAAAETRRKELLPALAEAVGVRPAEIFYTWARRSCAQRGRLADSSWSYFFHGLECDLHANDGRVLRFDFGPGGTVETFTAWGIFQFIFTSRPPWRDFTDSKARYGQAGWNGDDYRQGMTDSFVRAWDHLEKENCLAPAAPELVELERRYTTRGPDGIARIAFPAEVDEKTQIDCAVANRRLITPQGRRALARYRMTGAAL